MLSTVKKFQEKKINTINNNNIETDRSGGVPDDFANQLTARRTSI